MQKVRVYLIFGGRSGEHEVSLMSAKNVLAALDPEKYEVVPIGITREGRWLLTGDPMKSLMDGVEAAGGIPVALLGDPKSRGLVPVNGGPSLPVAEREGQVSVFFPVLHGTYGEDGTIQGLLEIAGVPYVGAGVLGSSVGMDKAVQKALFLQAGIPTPRFAVVLRREWEQAAERVLRRVEATFAYPVFVKPANLGSSVGVSKAKDREGLSAAMDTACRYDRKVMVEEAVNAREIEVSVLGNDEPIASIPGEIVPGREFYDYEAKYCDPTSRAIIPAPIPPETAEEVRRLALRAYKALDLAGMARVDFFLDRETGQLYLNEVNTIPGFTKISMYPKLWEASGLSYSALIDRLIQLALERHADKERNQTVR